MTISLLLIAAIGTADAKKSKKTENTEETKSTETVATSNAKANIPDDANSKKFAKALLTNAFSNFSPDIEGLVYKSIQFKSDNSWTTDAAIITPDAEMECIEAGTWTLDPAESATTGTLLLKLETTDCPSREAGESIRFRATLRGTEIDAEFR